METVTTKGMATDSVTGLLRDLVTHWDLEMGITTEKQMVKDLVKEKGMVTMRD